MAYPRGLTTTVSWVFPLSRPKTIFSISPFSTTSTRYPLQYDMIIHRPAQSSVATSRRRRSKPNSDTSSEPDLPQEPSSELNLDTWVDRKLSKDIEMDRSKRKYYNKRRRRMYGSDSDEDSRKNEDSFVELKPEVVEFDRLHKREEELYFYDAFAYPWEQDKHYKMVYQLEKKYFPDRCLDKAFLEPGELNSNANLKDKGKVKKTKTVVEKRGEMKDKSADDKRLVFFGEEEKDEKGLNPVKESNGDVTEKKVEEFFKYLKKVPNKNGEAGDGEPYLATRSCELPPRWDGPNGTVVLVNKPKG